MDVLNVIVAGLGAFAVGAIWYMLMGKPWMAASGVTEEQQRSGGPMPFVVGLVAMVVVAGMMRHIFAGSGISTWGAGLLAGAGIGAFFITPWMAMNYAFAQRKAALTVIDSVNAVAACAVMGVILTLF